MTPAPDWQQAPRWAQPRIFAALAFVLGLPALWVGRLADDHIHQAALAGRHPTMGRGLGDLFCFAPGDPDRWLDLVQSGYGWWMAKDLRLCFMRPFSSATILLDEALFGSAAVPAHLHSLLWAAAAAAMVHIVLRRLLPARIAAFGALLWVLDDARWMPSGWLANRNALLATVPVLIGIWAHLRWRQDGWRPGAWVGPLGVALGLAGGEPAVAAFALIFALVWGGLDRPVGQPPGTVVERLRVLLPYVVVGVLWAVPWALGGFGARSSGAYLDPLREPAAFGLAVIARLPVLFSAALWNAPADAWATIPATRVGLAASGAVAVALLLRWLRGSARRDPGGPPLATALWLLLAAALALLPSCATPPTTRVMSLPAVPLMALLGWLVVATERDGRRWLRRAILGWHGVVAPLAAVGYLVLVAGLNAVAQGYDDGPAMDGIAEKTVIVPWAPDVAVGLYPPFARRSKGLSAPKAWFALTMQRPGLQFERTAIDTIEARSPQLPLFGTLVEGLLAAPSKLPAQGEVRDLGALRVEVVEADAAGIRRVRFVFAAPLEDPRYLWLEPKVGGWRRFVPPPVGTRWEPPLMQTLFGIMSEANFPDRR